MSRLTVLLSQAPGKVPGKRSLEEGILAALVNDSGVTVSVLPHLYDLRSDHGSVEFLRSISGPLLVLAWMFPRAIHWTLNQLGVKGDVGETQLVRPVVEGTVEPGSLAAGGKARKPLALLPKSPGRKIWSLDLRESDTVELHVREVLRVAAELQNSLQGESVDASADARITAFSPGKSVESPSRRWYPVIDYSRCTNCLECIDFCLFGVYGVDEQERIIVEDPDNCKKGCPACSRVCPENAIVFPMHNTPQIAGAPGDGPNSLKLDLSKLFGAPDARETALQERESAQAKAGGASSSGSPAAPKSKDDLDRLMDAFDDTKL